MLNSDQLKALTLKAKIVTSLIKDDNIDKQDVIEYLNLEKIESPIKKLDVIFNLVCGILRDNKLKMPINIDIKELFENIVETGMDKEANFYYEFLNNLINDDINKDISERLRNLLQLDCENISIESSTKKLYLYNVLTILLATSPIDIDKINYYNEELKKYL